MAETIVPMLVSPSRQLYYPLDIWWGLSADEAEQGEGMASITWAMDITTLPQGFLDNPYAYSLDLFWEVDEEILSPAVWSGPIVKLEDTYQAETGLVVRKMDFEAFPHHLLRRRLAINNDHLPWFEFFGTPTTTWRKFAEQVMDTMDAKPTVAAGRMNAYPATSRGTWHASWTITSATPSDAGAATYKKTFESGNNMWDVLVEMCQLGDMAITISETAPGTWHLTISYPYLRDDLTSIILLSDLSAHVTGFSKTVDYTSLANVYFTRGDGQQSSTDAQWAQSYANTTSIGKYGIFEDGQTAVGVADIQSLGKNSESWVDAVRRGEPRVIVNLSLAQNLPGKIFGIDWGRRDKVRVHHSTMIPDYMDLVVREWSLSQDGPGQQPHLELVMGDSLYGWKMSEHLFNLAGGPAGRYGGGLLVTKAG